jgi:RNA polymerase sigma factor (sigma-70 family)
MGLAVNRAAPPDALVKQMRLSIGVPGARKRWQEIWERIAAKEIDVEELRSAHWEALHEGVPPEAIGTFIVDKLDNRRERREEPLPEVERCVDLELLASHLASPEEAAVRHSETEAVRTSLSALSHRQQEIARRYYYGGETDASIGRALGMSQQAVNKQRLAALDKLKELLS